MVLFTRWRVVVSFLGLIALTAFLTPLTETSEVKPEVNPYNDYLHSAIFVSKADAYGIYNCNEECDPDEGSEGTCETVSEAVYCGIQVSWGWTGNGFGFIYECDSFMADEDDPYCQLTNP